MISENLGLAKWYCNRFICPRYGCIYVARHQHVEAISCCRQDHRRYLWVPMHFFQIFLALPMGKWSYVKMLFQHNALETKDGKMEMKAILCKHLQRKFDGSTWWTKRSCGGKSSGAFACSFIFALNSASSSASFSNERSHILKTNKLGCYTARKFKMSEKCKHTMYVNLQHLKNIEWGEGKKDGQLRELMISRWYSQCWCFMWTPFHRCNRVLVVLKMRYQWVILIR